MAKVLLVGYIREIMEERLNVLLAGGHEVEIASAWKAADQATSPFICDVAVLGSCVPEQERSQIARSLISANPAIKIIMVYFSSIKNTELADALLPKTAGSEDILRAVNHILKPADRSKTG
ncbi:MAG: hypothetical protein WA738_02160 [Candidatus Angelobacter sp.]